MKKGSTAAGKATKNFSQPKLTIGLDLGDRSSWYCLLDEVGEVLLEQKRCETTLLFRGQRRRVVRVRRDMGSLE
jgi:hypothetical protein